MATFLPYNDAARLPIGAYPAIQRWSEQLEKLDAWREPFKGLAAPEMPPLPG